MNHEQYALVVVGGAYLWYKNNVTDILRSFLHSDIIFGIPVPS